MYGAMQSQELHARNDDDDDSVNSTMFCCDSDTDDFF